MGIEDIQISEELKTNAPSIKYRGDEGPKSPQEIEQMMMAQLEEEYSKYVNDMIEMGREDSIISIEQFMEQAMAEGQMAGGNPLPQDPTKPVNPFAPKPTGPVLPDRQMAARGGIMGADGRTGFLFGGIKKRIRKLIPNEVAKVAEVAAPFIAPFNPLAAAVAGGLGSFDRTGSISKGLKSGLMNYGLGQGARYLGGADLQQGLSLKMPSGNYFSKPTGTNKRFFDDIFKSKTTPGTTKVKGSSIYDNVEDYDQLTDMVVKDVDKTGPTGIMETIKGLIPESTLGKVALSGGALMLGTALLGQPGEAISEIMDRGEGLDIEAIRAEVLDAYNDETGEKILALRAKYPFLGRADTKDMSAMAMGGRIGFDNGGGFSQNDLLLLKRFKMNPKEVATYKDGGKELLQSLRTTYIPKAEGGIMDLGGMEKDYRNTGGFVDLGAKEKADDVPARLSVNEFVFTADAVRNAGGGNIDKGAEVMENMMKHLEQGGQVSDESQGMAGAQQMFETSERLSEVI